MKISFQDYGRTSVLTMSGEYTHEDTERFSRIVTERMDAGVKDVVLDCEHLEFVDSEGLESWVRARERLTAHQGQLRLVKPDDNVVKILEITRLDKSFQTHDDIESAMRSLR